MNTTFVHVTTQEVSELEKGSQNLKKIKATEGNFHKFK